MTSLLRLVFRLRRGLSKAWPLALCVAITFALWAGLLGPRAYRAAELVPLAVATLLPVALLRALLREVRRPADPRPTVREEVEFGVLLLVAVYALAGAQGGVGTATHAFSFLLVAILATTQHHGRAVWIWLGTAAVLEVGLAWQHPKLDAFEVLLRVLLLFACAGLHRLVLHGVVARLRRDHRARLDSELTALRQEARDFRLIASALPLESRVRSREDEETYLARSAVETIHERAFDALELLRSALDLHTCILLWCREASDDRTGRAVASLAIKEVSTRSDLIRDDPVLDEPRVLACILREPKPLRLHALGGRKLPPYYAGPEPVTDLCAVPLVDGAQLRGILCADRTGDRPFSDLEEGLLVRAAASMLRTIEHERVFAAVERGKYEQEQFYRASELLGRALTLRQVHETTFAALQTMTSYDLCVLTRYDAQSKRHGVVAVDAAAGATADGWDRIGAEWLGSEFADGAGYVSLAVKNRHFMPATGEVVDADGAVIFHGGGKLRGVRSALVLPLVHGDRVEGTLVLASHAPRMYRPETREMLRVLSHQIAVSLQNAAMYQAMEERATTDGLTGLTNRRSFQERLDQLHALCERTGQTYAVILTDIDHFKSINDTYGHPVGDEVLRKVASVFGGRARKVDIVARYGGEEFVLVLPDTDTAGAEYFANALREEVAQLTMSCDHGSFKVTVSMGVAAFPEDAKSPAALVAGADQALYHSKQSGRNRVTVASRS